MYGKPRPDSVKEKIRNKLLGTHASAETKEKLKNHYRQYGHPMTGKHHSESSKILIGNNTRGRRAVHKDGVYKKVRSDEYESYLNMGWLPGQK